MIKKARATEWKVQNWKLGQLPRGPSEGIEYIAPPTSGTSPIKQPSARNGQQHSRSFHSRCAVWQNENSPSRDGVCSAPNAIPSCPLSDHNESKRPFPNDARPSLYSAQRVDPFSAQVKFSQSDKAPSLNSLDSTLFESASSSRSDLAKTNLEQGFIADRERQLVTAVLQASHAEALAGGTADLLALLGRNKIPWGFSYTNVKHPCQVWLGERDRKVDEKSVRWMERCLDDCQVEILPGQGHQLMTSPVAIFKVFAALQNDANTWRAARAQ